MMRWYALTGELVSMARVALLREVDSGVVTEEELSRAEQSIQC